MAGRGKPTRRTAAAVGMVGLAAARGIGVPAHASTPLGIQELVCIPQGANLMECFVEATGGDAPYVAFPTTGTASITVTDAAGAAVSGSRGYTCVGGNER
jgi:hypothetical protein